MDIADIKKELISLGWGEQTLELAIRAKFKCEYCGTDILESVDSYYSIQVEHIIPKMKEGPDNSDNLAIVCKNCNFIKRNWDPRKMVPKEFQNRNSLLNVSKEYIQNKRANKNKIVVRMKDLSVELMKGIKEVQ